MSTIFGSAAFPMGHKFYNMFEYSYGRPLFSALNLKEMKTKSKCSFPLKLDTSQNNHSQKLVEYVINKTFKNKKSNFELNMHNIQPYHQLIPSKNRRNYLTRKMIENTKYVIVYQTGICFDKSGIGYPQFQQQYSIQVK